MTRPATHPQLPTRTHTYEQEQHYHPKGDSWRPQSPTKNKQRRATKTTTNFHYFDHFASRLAILQLAIPSPSSSSNSIRVGLQGSANRWRWWRKKESEDKLNTKLTFSCVKIRFETPIKVLFYVKTISPIIHPPPSSHANSLRWVFQDHAPIHPFWRDQVIADFCS